MNEALEEVPNRTGRGCGRAVVGGPCRCIEVGTVKELRIAAAVIALLLAAMDATVTPDERTDTATPRDPIDDAEARLAYVAVTRTRQRLDLGGLSWIHNHPDGTPPG